MISAIHNQDPGTPLPEGFVRYQVGDVWVDASGGMPLLAEVDAVRNPPKTKLQRETEFLAPYKLTRQTVQMIIGMGELDARLKALANGTTYEDELAENYLRNKTYKTACQLEAVMVAWP